MILAFQKLKVRGMRIVTLETQAGCVSETLSKRKKWTAAAASNLPDDSNHTEHSHSMINSYGILIF